MSTQNRGSPNGQAIGSPIGQSARFRAFQKTLQRAARTDVTVLLSGAAGAGKTAFAQALQQASSRRDQTFVLIDCRSVQLSLAKMDWIAEKPVLAIRAIEAEFTRQLQDADGGTILFDDIEALPLLLQAILLRFLDFGEIQKLGDNTTVTVDVRVVATTAVELTEQVEVGKFRKDLYFRLNVISLEIPPLSERKDDILPLMEHYMFCYAEKYRLAKCRLEADVLPTLRAYAWPNNLAELRQVSERLALTRAGQVIEESHLPESIRQAIIKQPIRFELPEKGIELIAFEADMIRQALNFSKGNRTQSARLLGISRHVLLYRMQKHGIAYPGGKSLLRQTALSNPSIRKTSGRVDE